MPNTREKLIELVAQGMELYCKTTEGMLREVIADHLIANGVTLQQWIPVTERFPEIGRRILTLQSRYGEPFIYIDQFCSDGEWLFSTYKVTHWMPLPSTEGLK